MKANNYSIKRRNFKEFYFENEILVEPFGFPKIYSSISMTGEFYPFNKYMSLKDKNVCVHFFIDDYQFERLWTNTTQYIEVLKKAKVVLSPDFSMYIDMPKAVQIYNCYRSRALAKFLQKNGVNIVPVVCWSDEDSFAWCFDGIKRGSNVAVSSNGCYQNPKARQNFLKGFNEMIERIKPNYIYFVGKVPKEIETTKNLIIVKSEGQIFAETKWRE